MATCSAKRGCSAVEISFEPTLFLTNQARNGRYL
jgi:hypothetical protein